MAQDTSASRGSVAGQDRWLVVTRFGLAAVGLLMVVLLLGSWILGVWGRDHVLPSSALSVVAAACAAALGALGAVERWSDRRAQEEWRRSRERQEEAYRQVLPVLLSSFEGDPAPKFVLANARASVALYGSPDVIAALVHWNQTVHRIKDGREGTIATTPEQSEHIQVALAGLLEAMRRDAGIRQAGSNSGSIREAIFDRDPPRKQR